MKRILFLGMAIMTFGQLMGQDNNIWYFDREWEPCHKSRMHYFRTLDSTDKPDVFIVKDWYRDSTVQMIAPFRLTADYINWGLAEVSMKNEKGYPVDTVSWFYEDGSRDALRHYKDGELHGLTRGWYESGYVEREGLFYMGEQDSTWHFYYDSGRVQEIQTFDKGIKTGTWEGWHENGNKEYLAEYEDNELNGLLITYNEEGQMLTKRHFEKGLRQGTAYDYWENGQLKNRVEYVDDKMQGPFKSWHENGMAHVIGQFDEGKKTGKWVFYYDQGGENENDSLGQKSNEGAFEDDLKHGHWQAWHPNGVKAFDGEFLHGKENGEHKKWDEEGDLVWEEEFEPKKSFEERVAEEADSMFTLKPLWSKQDVFDLTIYNTEISHIDGELDDQWSIRKRVAIEVLDSSRYAYYFNWKYIEYTSENTPATFALFDEYYPGLEMTIRMDRRNMGLEIYNWEAVQEQISRSLDSILVSQGASYSKEELDQYKESFLERENMEPIMLREAQQFFSYYGIELPGSDVEITLSEEETEADFSKTNEYLFEEMDEDEGIYRFTALESIEEEESDYLLYVLASMVEIPRNVMENVEYIALSDSKEVEFNLNNGHITELLLSTEFGINDFRKQIIVEYKAIYSKKEKY